MKLFSINSISLVAIASVSLMVSPAWSNEEAAADQQATEAHGETAHGGGDHDVILSTKGANLNLLKQPARDVEKGTAPATPVLMEPTALQKISGTAVTLKWQAVAGADAYHVQVATDPNFKWLVADEANFPQTSFQPQGLNAGQQYFWRVAARKTQNTPAYTKSFFVGSSFETK